MTKFLSARFVQYFLLLQFFLVLGGYSLIPRAYANGLGHLVINELFVDGSSNYPDWIELYNCGDTPISLKGHSLTNDLDELGWVIQSEIVVQPKAYKVFFCDKKGKYDHTNFRLKSRNGAVGLYAPSGEMLDSIVYKELPRYTSIGIDPNGSGKYLIYESPTLGESNTRDGRPYSAAVNVELDISPQSGRYDGPLNVSVHVRGEYVLRYTTDGSIPHANSRIYTTPIRVTETTVLQIAAFSSDGQLVKNENQIYIIGEQTKLPIVSIVTDPKNLWDPEIGIYTEGNALKNGRAQSENWRYNWRRAATIDFLSDDSWRVNGEIRIFGGTSRSRQQKSFAVYATSSSVPYGLHYKVFPEVDRVEYAGLILRNGGDAWLRTQIRDAFFQELIKGRTSCETHLYRPVIGYLNGKYWGVYGLRELFNKENLLRRHNLPLQPVSILEGGVEIGASKDIFVNISKITSDSDYREMLSEMNVDAFLDYLALEIYSGNPDWIAANTKCWRPKSKAIKWQWILYDMDRAYNGKRGKKYDYDPFILLSEREGASGLYFSTLSKNKFFIRDLCARLSVHMLTTFDPSRSEKILNRLALPLRPEMSRHIDRWRYSWQLDRLFMSVAKWEEALQSLLEYGQKRPQAFLHILNERFHVGKPSLLDLQLRKDGEGHFTAECVPLENDFLKGYVPQSLNFLITAIPAQGYIFKCWNNDTKKTSPQIWVSPGNPVSMLAVFEKIEDSGEK